MAVNCRVREGMWLLTVEGKPVAVKCRAREGEWLSKVEDKHVVVKYRAREGMWLSKVKTISLTYAKVWPGWRYL